MIVNRFKYISSIKSGFKYKQMSGMTFIEVLVAFFIISTGILGSVALLATAKQGSFDAMQRTLASGLAQDMIARMRANNPNILVNYVANDYGALLDDIPINRCNAIDIANACTPAQMLANDQFEWELGLMGGNVTSALGNTGGLLDARGCIAVNGNSVTVVVTWNARKDVFDAAKADGCGTASTKRRQVVLRAFIL